MGEGWAGLAASVLLLLEVVTALLVLPAQEALGARSLQDGAVLEGRGLCPQHHLHQAEDADDLRQSRAQQGTRVLVRGRPGGLSTQPGPGAPSSASLGLRRPVCKRSLFRAEAVGSW